ncbi:hypothetical protein Leryth_026749 [Lithospermum erythrorhizon]|nr:hypothetical protein Leryth_026749 [Lithospermum erythrorhizon]
MAKAIPRRRNGRIGLQYQKELFMFKATFVTPLFSLHRYTGSGGFLGLCRYFWIQGYKKGDAVAAQTRQEMLSYSSRSRYATSRSHDKALVSEETQHYRAIRRSGILITFVRDMLSYAA